MTPTNDDPTLRLAIPKGRMYDGIRSLLADAGIRLVSTSRDYRPFVTLEGVEAKILKPQNVIGMLSAGARDVGFAGADWVDELGAEVVELLDTRLDPVRLVAAAPAALVENGGLRGRSLVIASEYAELTRRWIERSGLDARVFRTFGATEVFPPEDADAIVDNTATGATLEANGLKIVDELMRSSTRLYANPQALEHPVKRGVIERLVTLLRAVLAARSRVMVEVNVEKDKLDGLIEVLPCMREATVSMLHGSSGYAVRAAVPRDAIAEVVPLVKARGGTDVVVSPVELIVP